MKLNNRKIHLDTAYNFESQCWDIRREVQEKVQNFSAKKRHDILDLFLENYIVSSLI